MIIRSQNKMGIVNFNNLDSICIERNHCGCDVVCFNGLEESRSKIGEYSTEAKAIKVLDMIENTYVESLWTDSQMIIANRVCFDMPKDEDVEV